MWKSFWPFLLVVCLIMRTASASSGAPMPQFAGIDRWLNTPQPLSPAQLRGEVVLVDFWTYSCVNCLRTLPQLEAWYQRYHASGLEIAGVHSPEFAFEKDPANVQTAVRRLGVTYPVALDNEHATWNAYYNRYWPAEYLFDRQGAVVHQHFGEGGYQQTEMLIRKLLQQGHPELHLPPPTPMVASLPSAITPEIYLGTDRLSHNGQPVTGGTVLQFEPPAQIDLDHFYLVGGWRFRGQDATLVSTEGKIIIRFRANQANMVLATDHDQVILTRVLIDGKPATATNHGADVSVEPEQSVCRVHEARLYTLAQFPPTQSPGDHVLEVDVTSPGLRAYTFTFG